MVSFEVNAQSRSEMGKAESRRMRQTGKIPAIVYGAGKDPAMLALSHSEMLRHLEDEAFYSHILTLNVDGANQKVVLKDVQRHPAKPFILHVDFMRVDESHKIRMLVPLHFINEETAVGVKQDGGSVAHLMNEVEIQCLPQNLPEYLEVDVAELHAGDSIQMSQIKLPEGVEIVELTHGEDHDQAIVTINKARGGADEEEGEASAAPEEGAGEE